MKPCHFDIMNDLITRVNISGDWELRYVLYYCLIENYRNKKYGVEKLSID